MRRIRSRIRVGKGATKRIASQGKPISGTYAGGSGLKVPPALRNKLVAALAKAAAQPSKAELQTGWFYSLDLEPAENLGAELSLIGSEPPGKAVTHPDYKPQVLTAAAPNAEGGWTLMPVTNCVMGDGKAIWLF